MATTIDVLILMGSDSDAPVMQAAVDVLRELDIPCEMTVASAHRSPERVMRLVREAPGRVVFARREDLLRIKGIGPAMLEALDPYLIFPPVSATVPSTTRNSAPPGG